MKTELNSKLFLTLKAVTLPLAFILPVVIIVFSVGGGTIRALSDMLDLVTLSQPNIKSDPAKTTAPATPTPQTTPSQQLPDNAISLNEITMPVYGEKYGNLVIEDLGIDCDLYFGDGDAALKKGAGQYNGSLPVGFGGEILIAGHNHMYFKPLKKVEVGQIVVITTDYGVFKYEITATEILDEKDKSAYDLANKNERLVLYTCYPFEGVGYKSRRVFVYADKIDGPVVVW